MHKLASALPAMLLAILGLEPAAAAGFTDNCEHSADRSAAVDSNGVTKVVIAAGAGDLTIRGSNTMASIRANGEACASTKKLLDQVQLESRREGDTVYLRTVMPEAEVGFLWFDNYATLDLTISLPASMQLDVEDGSGDTEINGVRSLVLADGSGDLDLSGIDGDLRMSDSSGDIEIERIAGNVEIKDSSGDMEIEEVQGSVYIPTDSSGDMEIERVGSVHVRQDSSGGIYIREARGDVTIDSDSSGDIRVVQIGGNFMVRADTSGDISHDRVAGNVQMPPRD